jgi:hypothetical protein
MKRSLIPWHVFREAIAGQEPATLESWLDRWGFTDNGVILIGAQTHSRAPALLESNNDRFDVAPSALQTSVLRILLGTGRLITEDRLEPWSYNKEL